MSQCATIQRAKLYEARNEDVTAHMLGNHEQQGLRFVPRKAYFLAIARAYEKVHEPTSTLAAIHLQAAHKGRDEWHYHSSHNA